MKMKMKMKKKMKKRKLKMEAESDLEKQTTEVPSVAAGPPVVTDSSVQEYKQVEQLSEKFWKDRSLTQLKNFKQGLTFSSNVPPKDYDVVLKNLLYILETGIKNGNKNDQLLTKVQITAIFKSLMSSIEVLKSLNLDVDKNEIIAILHGYITGCINSYEK